MSKSTSLVVANAFSEQRPAHTGSGEVWLCPDLRSFVGVGTRISIFAATLQEELAHVGFEKLSCVSPPHR